MKKLFIFVLLTLLTINLRAANPAYENFDPVYFTRIGNVLTFNLGTIPGGSASNVFFLDSSSINWTKVGVSNVASLATAVSNEWRNYTLSASNSITANLTNYVIGVSNGLVTLIQAGGTSGALTNWETRNTFLTNFQGAYWNQPSPVDLYRWMEITNGRIRMPAWNSGRVGPEPGLAWFNTNGNLVANISTWADHNGAASTPEMLINAAHNIAIRPGDTTMPDYKNDPGIQLGNNGAEGGFTTIAQAYSFSSPNGLPIQPGWGHSHAFKFQSVAVASQVYGNPGIMAFNAASNGVAAYNNAGLGALRFYTLAPYWNGSTQYTNSPGIAVFIMETNSVVFTNSPNGSNYAIFSPYGSILNGVGISNKVITADLGGSTNAFAVAASDSSVVVVTNANGRLMSLSSQSAINAASNSITANMTNYVTGTSNGLYALIGSGGPGGSGGTSTVWSVVVATNYTTPVYYDDGEISGTGVLRFSYTAPATALYRLDFSDVFKLESGDPHDSTIESFVQWTDERGVSVKSVYSTDVPDQTGSFWKFGSGAFDFHALAGSTILVSNRHAISWQSGDALSTNYLHFVLSRRDTITNGSGSGTPVTFNSTQFGSSAAGTNLLDGAPITNAFLFTKTASTNNLVVHAANAERSAFKIYGSLSQMFPIFEAYYNGNDATFGGVFPNGLTVEGQLLAENIYGNGANITDINAANITGNLSVDTLTATTLVTGNVQRSTNSVASVTAINLTYGFAYTNHTANFTITGFTAGTYNGTNMQIANRLYTNDSVGAKTITLPASWIDLGSVGNPVYNTNIGQLGIQVVPGFATNYVWAGK